MDVVQAFREGGTSMYLVLALDLVGFVLVPLALVIATVARFTGKGRGVALAAGVLGLLLALAPMCAGLGGYLLSMSKVDAAVVNADPEQREVLRAYGEAEASNNLTFGLGSGCACLAPAVLALLLVPPKKEVYEEF